MGIFVGDTVANGINQNILNDFNAQQSIQPGYTNVDEAMLYIYSPQQLPIQVARPFVYQFTPEMIDSITQQSNYTYEFAVGPCGRQNKALLTSIVPDSNGRIADMSTITQLWSFVLIVDMTPTVHGGMRGPSTRVISLGYFYGEPCTVSGTQTILNPNAVMTFTHSTSMLITRHAGMTGDKTRVTGRGVDYASDFVCMLFKDNTYLGTPKESMLCARQMQSALSGMTDISSLDISHAKAGVDETSAIRNHIKAPRAHLSEIMRAVDGSVASAVDDNGYTDGLEGYNDRLSASDKAFNNAVSRLPSGHELQVSIGLDTSRPHMLNEVMQMYPNLKVFPFMLSQSQSWDSLSEVTMYNGKLCTPVNIKNQLSSLVSNVVQCLCGNCWVSCVAFSYMSYTCDSLTKEPAFRYDRFDLMMANCEQDISAVAMRFKQYLEDQLFSVIKAISNSEFTLNVLANMGGDILVDLRLMNYPDPQDGTYYHTSAKLGGLLNPMLYDQSTISNNVTQLSNMMDQLIGKSIRDDTFGMQYMSNMNSY